MSGVKPTEALMRDLEGLMVKHGASLPKRRTGPVMCNDCKRLWTDCTCGLGICQGIVAFHDGIGGTVKLFTCEDTAILQHETDKKTESLIFTEDEFTQIATIWLAQKGTYDEDHDHVYKKTLDPHYLACSCGVIKRTKVKAS